MTARIRTGLIGAGAFGANHAAKLAGLAQSDFQGVFDLDAARASEIAGKVSARAFESLEALLSACDAVIVATPARTHGRVALQAIQAGKHALVEKPLAATVSEAHALIDAAARAGVALMVGHQERFVLQALGLFDAPERPTLIESVREGPFTGRAMDVSVTFDLMIHDLDLATALFGDAPQAIEARGSAERGPEFDAVSARLTFAGGIAQFTASRIAAARKRTMRVVFPSGEARVDFLARTMANETPFSFDTDFAAKVPDPLGRNVEEFLDAAITGRRISTAPAAAAVALAAAIDAAAAR
ncbi:MAG: Gfo/Idh/MocA family protein [Hyphomonadaceae bacterium]